MDAFNAPMDFAALVKGHRTRVNVVSKTFYIKQTRCSAQALLDPSLPLTCKPKDLGLEDLLGTDHTFEVWEAYFYVLKTTKPGAGTNSLGSLKSWEDAEPPTLTNLKRANDTFKTPKKLKFGAMLSPAHVTFTPQSHRQILSKIKGMDKVAEEEDWGQQMRYII
jgi:hypothetical protein